MRKCEVAAMSMSMRKKRAIGSLVTYLMVIAAYEVGAADARLEYHIARYGPFGLGEIEDYAAR